MMLRSAPTTSWGRAEYLVPFVEKYDAVILSSKDYARKLTPIVQLIKDRELRERLEHEAKQTVRQRFLLTRYLEQYLDLLNSFEADFRLTNAVSAYQ